MGTALQEARFKYNEMEELRNTIVMRRRIDMSRVKLDVLMPWISAQISEIYDIEGFVYEELKKEQHVCPKIFELKLLQFLSSYKVQQFTVELFELLLISQENGIGIPTFLMQEIKEEEILIREEEKKRKRNDSPKCRHCSCPWCSKRDDRVVDDKNSNQSSSKWEKSRSSDKNTSTRNRLKDKSVQRGYPSSDSCSPQSEKESAHSLKTSQSKSSQKKRYNTCMRNSKSLYKSVEKQEESSTCIIRRCDESSDDSYVNSQCAWCGRTSCYLQSSVSSNRSRSPTRLSATREDVGKQEYRSEKQIAEVIEKRKHSDVKDTTTTGSQTSVKRSQKEITITPQSSLPMKGSSVPKSEHKKTKSDTESSEAVNGGKVVLERALVNCTQSAMNNKCKKLKNDPSHVNKQFQVKKKRKKSKKSSSKRNSADHCLRNPEAGSSKN